MNIFGVYFKEVDEIIKKFKNQLIELSQKELYDPTFATKLREGIINKILVQFKPKNIVIQNKYLMNKFRALQQFLLNIDQFGQPVNLKIGRSPVYNTVLGSCFTLIMIVILMRSLYSMCFELFDKGNPQVLLSEEYMLSPGVSVINIKKFTVKHDDFDLAYLIFDKQGNLLEDPNHQIMKPQFGFVAYELYSYDYPINISFVPCNKLSNNKQQEDQQVGLIKDIFQYGMCLNKTMWQQNENLTALLGGYADYNLTAMYFIFQECKDEAEGKIQLKPGCLSEANRSKLDDAYVYITYTDLSIDQENKDKPISQNYQLLSTNLNRKIQKTRTIFLSKTYFIDIINPFYFFSKIIEYEGFKMSSFQADQDFDQTFLLIYGWQLDNVKTTFQRTYPTILSVLGQLGGLYSSLFCILNTLLKPYVKQSCFTYLINKVYQNETFRGHDQIQENIQIKEFQTWSEFKDYFLKESTLRFQDVIFSLLGFKRNDGKYVRAVQKIDKHLDILKLIKSYHKQKHLLNFLLDSQQRDVFKIRQRPIIPQVSNQSKFVFQNLISSYKSIMQDQSRMNRQLIKSVDWKIKSYLFSHSDIWINSIQMEMIQNHHVGNTEQQVLSPRQEEQKLVHDLQIQFQCQSD